MSFKISFSLLISLALFNFTEKTQWSVVYTHLQHCTVKSNTKFVHISQGVRKMDTY